MPLTKTFQHSSGHLVFQQLTVPVSVVKQLPPVTLRRPFIKPISRLVVSRTSPSQSLLVPVRYQYCNLLNRSARFLPARLLLLSVKRLFPLLQLPVFLHNMTPTLISNTRLTWFFPESKLHINCPELKWSFWR